jgi:hypothetical protein
MFEEIKTIQDDEARNFIELNPNNVFEKPSESLEYLESIDRDKSSNQLFKIIEYYKNNYKPSDLVFQTSNALLKEGLQDSNFAKTLDQWEWFNQDITFYTYKITSPKSDKYYFGVRMIQVSSATISDCFDDRYYGSGRKNSTTNKFSNWKRKYSENLEKEVLEIFTTKAEAYHSEYLLIGDSWKTDNKCLNSTWGGSHGGIGLSLKRIGLKICLEHGETKHIGSECYSCISEKMNSHQDCPEHGLVKFRGDTCITCSVMRNYKVENCENHGEVKHYGGRCSVCHTEKSVSLKICSVHGESKHVGILVKHVQLTREDITFIIKKHLD